MHAETRFDPSVPLATATVQDIHLELIRRSEHNAFHGDRVLADLLSHRQDWQAMLFDTYGLATDRGLPARLIKLRDMAANEAQIGGKKDRVNRHVKDTGGKR